MRRGIGRLRAGGGGFSPSSISFTSGLWLDQSDITTGFQDSAGTIPQTASGQQTGKRLDKSGRGNHVTQATAGSRPEWDVISGISSDFTDGTDDNLAVTFGAGTLVSSMDVFVAVKRATTGITICLGMTAVDSSHWLLDFNSGAAAAGTAVFGAGATWNALINGVQVGTTGATSAAQLHAALSAGTWAVAEVQGVDLSAWTGLCLAAAGSTFSNADFGGIIVCPAQSTANRTAIRRWLGGKVGLSL